MAYLIGGYIVIVLVVAMIKKVKAYDAFLTGVRDGLTTVINMFSTMLCFVLIVEAIKGCGILDDLKNALNVNLLVQALIRPFSASSSMAMMIAVFEVQGVDSKEAILSTFYHTSLDTSLYMLAMYFSIHQIKETRYALPLILVITLFSYAFIALFYVLFFS